MDETEELRGGQEQINEELRAMHKRMTDPEERRKHQMKEKRKQFALSVANDAGL